jgi:hypothetical protein
MTTTQCALILVAVVGLAASGCGKLKPRDSLDAAATEASAHDALIQDTRPDVAAESPTDIDVDTRADVGGESTADVGAEAPDLDGGVACGPMTCDSGTFCLESFQGVDAGPSFECDAVSACDGGVPTCACVSDFTHSPSVFAGRCAMECSQSDARHLLCAGA